GGAAADEEDDRFSDQPGFLVAKEVGDRMRETGDEIDPGDSGFLFELPPCGVFVRLTALDMTFGIIPVPAIVEQEIGALMAFGIIAINHNAGGSFVSGHGWQRKRTTGRNACKENASRPV